MDWKTINEIDYSTMWRSVSETEEMPVAGHLREIQDVQENDLRQKSMVEHWLLEEVECFDESVTVAQPVGLLYSVFLQWCAEQNALRTAPSRAWFGRELARLGVVSRRTMTGATYFVRLRPGFQQHRIT